MADFKVERQQLQSGRWIQVLVYEHNGEPWRVFLGPAGNEQDAMAMSVSLENAIKTIAGQAEPNEPPVSA
jgi:hypothetical protein